MNDDELLTRLREQRTRIAMTMPVEQILRRGSAVRTRRRASGLAMLAAVMFAAIALLASSHPPRQGMQLAAWTVVKHSDGTVGVTIRELHNPAGLQRKLRADGVPSSVIFGDQPNPCQSYGHPELLSNVVTPSTAPGQPQGVAIVMVLHPSALPSAAGVQIITNQTNVGVHLVTASNGCTG